MLFQLNVNGYFLKSRTVDKAVKCLLAELTWLLAAFVMTRINVLAFVLGQEGQSLKPWIHSWGHIKNLLLLIIQVPLVEIQAYGRFDFFVMVESLGLSCRSWIMAWGGATTDRVCVLSSDITSVATFMGFIAVIIPSADVVWLTDGVDFLLSLPHFTWEEGGTGVWCCSRNHCSMSKALFHLVTTPAISLCSGSYRFSRFSFCHGTWLAVVLCVKKLVMRLALPSMRATDGRFSAFDGVHETFYM